jgi:pepF/M3 family oligoendopeptidase
MSKNTPPRWDLSGIYPGLDSPELAGAIQLTKDQTAEFEQLLLMVPAIDAPSAELAAATGSILTALNSLLTTSGTVRSYIGGYVTTDSFNDTAMRLYSEFEQLNVRIQQQILRFSAWVGKISARIDEIIYLDPVVAAHAFFLLDTAAQSRYLMAPELEDLAAELSLNGASAWSKLQGTITSQLSTEFEINGQVQTLPLPALINLHSHPDESVRHRAYEAEIQLLASARVPLAAALNSVKGMVNTLEHRRGRVDALHSAVDIARIDRAALEAMLSAMQASFPTFHRYFHAKARRLGKERLAWWDLFAPTESSETIYTYPQAVDFVLSQFDQFAPDMGIFARKAFSSNWIDAEQRKGKRGGAFCMEVPGLKESRVLCNFDGTLDQVFTIAHELGHAFHNDCAYSAGKTVLQADTPMTMAETASTLCETVLTEAALSAASTARQQLSILETALIGDSQIIVDIYSRYLFEKEVFERRANAELSPDDFCDIMLRAQKATYGDGIDERYLHPYMWTWKPHYYYPNLNFYNFPYAFGQLFSIGLYAVYKQRGPAFVTEYKALLASTGEARVADLALRFDIDIRSFSFWESSLAVIASRIERYIAL